MAGLLKTAIEFFRLPSASSLFERGYAIQFELDDLRRPAPVPSELLRVETEICYHPQPATPRSLQSLAIYAPENGPANGHFPVVLFMHGGGWRCSDKNDPLGVHANVCKALAGNGIVAVNVNYRLSPSAKHPQHVRDAAFAVRWVIDNIGSYGGDREKLYLSGHSAGGHLAALLALDAQYLNDVGLSQNAIKGVIGICGIYNLHHFASRNWMAEHLMTRAAFGKAKAQRTEASPVHYVREGAPPFLLLNAQHDERLEEEAEELASLLRSRGGAAETAIIAGTNHFSILSLVGNGDDTLIERIVAFVRISDFGFPISNFPKQRQSKIPKSEG
ncbi:MAG: alpha/beta hydrolase [Pyrinomonadaceae bacterium]